MNNRGITSLSAILCWILGVREREVLLVDVPFVVLWSHNWWYYIDGGRYAVCMDEGDRTFDFLFDIYRHGDF